MKSLAIVVSLCLLTVFNGRADVSHASHTTDAARDTIALINHINYVVETIQTYNNVIVLEQEYKAISASNLNLNKIPDEEMLELIKCIVEHLHSMRMDERKRKYLQEVLNRNLGEVKLECSLKVAQNMLTAATSGTGGGDLFGISAVANMAKTLAVTAAASAMEFAVSYTKLSGELRAKWQDETFELDAEKLNTLNNLNKTLLDAQWKLLREYNLDDSLRITSANVKALTSCLKNPNRKGAYATLLPRQRVFSVYPTYWYYRALLALENDDIDDALYSAEVFQKVNRGLFRSDSMASVVAMVKISAMIEANKDDISKLDKVSVEKDLNIIYEQLYDAEKVNVDLALFSAMIYFRVLQNVNRASEILDSVYYGLENEFNNRLKNYCDLHKAPEQLGDSAVPDSTDLVRCRMLRFEIDKKIKRKIDSEKLKELCRKETTSSIEKLYYFGQVRMDDLWKIAVRDIKGINLELGELDAGRECIIVEVPIRWYLLGDMPVTIDLRDANGKIINIAESRNLRMAVSVKGNWKGCDKIEHCMRLVFPIKKLDLKGLSSIALSLKHKSWPVNILFEPNDSFIADEGRFSNDDRRFIQIEASGFMGENVTKRIATSKEIAEQKESKCVSLSIGEIDEKLKKKGVRRILPSNGDVAVRVNGVELKNSELQVDVDKLIKRMGKDYSALSKPGQREVISELKKKQAENFIKTSCLVKMAMESGFRVTNEDRRRRERELVAEKSKTLEEIFDEYPLGADRAQREFEDGVLIGKMLSKKIEDDASVKILLSKIDLEKADCKIRASAALKEFEGLSGVRLEKEFVRLAKKHSDCPSKDKGGNLGEFRRGQMVKEFEKAAFTAPIMEPVGPVETQFGSHLILVLKRTKGSGKGEERVCARHILFSAKKMDEELELRKNEVLITFIHAVIRSQDIEISDEYKDLVEGFGNEK